VQVHHPVRNAPNRAASYARLPREIIQQRHPGELQSGDIGIAGDAAFDGKGLIAIMPIR